MRSTILDAITQARDWHEELSRLPEPLRDVYFTPEYLSLQCCVTPDSRPLLFCFGRGEHLWIYPFLLRRILRVGGRALPELWHDIESAYGYGGPLSSTDSPEFLAEAHQAFSNWCNQNAVVAEFSRLHPFLKNERWLPSETELHRDRATVSLRLADLRDGALPFEKKARNTITKAIRDGLEIRQSLEDADFDRFRQFYLATMEKVRADDFYSFAPGYFRSLAALVRRSGMLLSAYLGTECIAAAVFLKGPTFLHYHLAGSSAEKRVPGAANLILLTAAMSARDQGRERLHLGGGRTSAPDDPLLLFKRSMGTDLHDFFIGRRVHNMDRYQTLRGIWSQSYPALAQRYGARLLCYRYEA